MVKEPAPPTNPRRTAQMSTTQKHLIETAQQLGREAYAAGICAPWSDYALQNLIKEMSIREMGPITEAWLSGWRMSHSAA